MFHDVSISLPAKVRGPEAEEEWQEVDWVTWSTGSLTVETESFLILFKPTGGGNVKAKSLGNLVRATSVAQEGEVKTLIVTTSESLHKTFRLTFSTGADTSEFLELADRAEQAHEAASKMQDTCAVDPSAEAARLESSLRAKLADRWPLIFTGAELYGPDPNGESSTEVLLGRGAAVLLDPPDTTNKVGTYELLFYCEDEDSKPSQTFAISPEMTLTRQDDEDGEGLAASYLLKGPSMSAAHSLCFEDSSVAGNFVRDFRVRSRLMDMSLKTVRGRAAAQDLRKDLESLKQNSLAARLWTVIRLLLVVAFFLVAGRAAQLVSRDSGRPPMEYLTTIYQDVGSVLQTSASATSAAGAKVCEVAFGTVDASGVRQCSKEIAAHDIRQCIDSLVGYGPAMGW